MDGDVLVFEGGQLRGEYPVDEDHPAITAPPMTDGSLIRVVHRVPFTDRYSLAEGYEPSVEGGAHVRSGDVLATAIAGAEEKGKKGSLPERPNILARSSGIVHLTDGEVGIDTSGGGGPGPSCRCH